MLHHEIKNLQKDVNLQKLRFFLSIFRNRISRENSILKAIENGAHTLFDIVANVYSDVDRRFWIPAASNVRLHVDHLTQQNKLPKVIFVMLYKFLSLLYVLTFNGMLSDNFLHAELVHMSHKKLA